MMLSGMPLVESKSPEFGTLLIVDLKYRGLAEPKSHPTYSKHADGGFVA
tara:strand:- start:127 stop:273 length:147 start_codon:yes stop_codon:yes gene_type:complete